jgi:predicted 3-demethylubiquinone-9 3-methyltransferase (glyoxalase superfamily)
MKSSIYPCIWFNGNAQEAAEHYCVAFANAGVKICTPMVLKANPSVSFLPSVNLQLNLIMPGTY